MKTMREIIEASRAGDYNRGDDVADTQTVDMYNDYLPAIDQKNADRAQKLQDRHGKKIILKKLKKLASEPDTTTADAIVDFAYSVWREHDNTEGAERWTFSDMVNYAEQTFGKLGKLNVLTSVYNGQVNNGGHAQYFDNGYASGATGFGPSRSPDDIEGHLEMMGLMKELGITADPIGAAAYRIMEDFTTSIGPDDCGDCNGDGQWECDECGGSGEIEREPDEYGDIEVERCETCRSEGSEECHQCGGTGEDERNARVDGSVIDSAWYKIGNSFMALMAVKTDELVKNMYQDVYSL